MRHRIFWGIVIILLGVLFLLEGVFKINAWGFFWPLLLIAAGIWVLLTRLAPVQEMTTEEFSLPLEGASSAKIVLKHGAGVIALRAMQSKSDVLRGTFVGGVHANVQRENDHVHIVLRSAADFRQIFPRLPHGQGLDWDISLNKDIPLKLKMETGASENRLDLSGLEVTELKIETGASATEIDLPKSAGFCRVHVSSGAASLVVRVPAKVAAKIHVEGLVSKEIDQQRFPATGAYFQSPDYESAKNKVEIHVESGVGSVEIK